MKNTKYSCQNKPAKYKLLHKNKEYPKPDKNTYYWHITNLTHDMDKYKVILAFEKVMATWQRAFDGIAPIGPYIDFKSTSDISKARFIFSFGKGVHHFKDKNNGLHTCPFNFDGQQGVLAHAWSLNTGHPYGGQIHFDEDENWGDMHKRSGQTLYAHLYTVVLHEMGHCFDLDHSTIQESVMYPSYTGEKLELHADDIAGLQKKMSPVKKKVYNTFFKNKKTKKKTLSKWTIFWHKVFTIFE